MSKSLREHLKAHYGGLSLSEDVLAGMIQEAGSAAPRSVASVPAEPAPALRLAPWIRVAAAACVGLLVTGVVYQQSRIVRLNRNLASTQAELSEARAALLASGDRVAAAVPRLVAVCTTAEGCPRTSIIEPVYQHLAAQFGNEPVLFISLDISDENACTQARKLASSLGIDCLAAEPFQSGVIRLVDRQRNTVLASCFREDQEPQIESAILLALNSADP